MAVEIIRNPLIEGGVFHNPVTGLEERAVVRPVKGAYVARAAAEERWAERQQKALAAYAVKEQFLKEMAAAPAIWEQRGRALCNRLTEGQRVINDLPLDDGFREEARNLIGRARHARDRQYPQELERVLEQLDKLMRARRDQRQAEHERRQAARCTGARAARRQRVEASTVAQSGKAANGRNGQKAQANGRKGRGR